MEFQTQRSNNLRVHSVLQSLMVVSLVETVEDEEADDDVLDDEGGDGGVLVMPEQQPCSQEGHVDHKQHQQPMHRLVKLVETRKTEES